jgi:hypothetical protein
VSEADQATIGDRGAAGLRVLILPAGTSDPEFEAVPQAVAARGHEVVADAPAPRGLWRILSAALRRRSGDESRPLSGQMRRLEAATPLPRAARRWLERENFDVVAVPTPLDPGSSQAEYLRIAQGVGVPTVVLESGEDAPTATERAAGEDVEPRRGGGLRILLWALSPLLVLLFVLRHPVLTARAVARAVRKAWKRLRKRIHAMGAKRRELAAREARERERAAARAQRDREKEAEKARERAAQEAEKAAQKEKLQAEKEAEREKLHAQQEAERARARQLEMQQRKEQEALKAEAHALKVERIRAHNEKRARAEAKRAKEERAREKAAKAAGGRVAAGQSGPPAAPAAGDESDARKKPAKSKAAARGDFSKRMRRMRGRTRKAIRGRAKLARRRWKLTKRGVRRIYNRRYRWSYRSTIMRVPARDELPALLNARGLLGKGVEIGVKTGLYSNELLTFWKGQELISIDPWLSAPAEEYVDRSNVSQDEFEEYYQQTRERLAPHGSRSTIWRMTSVEAAPRVPDGSLDFVYIDARHDYDSVKEDLAYWCSKVRPGGILAGHDYVDGDFDQGEFYVKSAVDEFFGERGIPVHGTEGPSAVELFPTWIVEVPPEGIEPPRLPAPDAGPGDTNGRPIERHAQERIPS